MENIRKPNKYLLYFWSDKLISLDTKVNLAFFLSMIAIIWNVFLYLKGRKIERIKIYDKVYSTSEWLLMYEYNKLRNQEYNSEDKFLEQAVREHTKSHDMAQFFGMGFKVPEHLINEEDKSRFCRLVIDEFTKHSKLVSDQSWNDVMTHNQSPVFCIENDEFKEKFDFVFKYVGENLSYFSDAIKENWHKAQNMTMDHVKQQYISLNSLNENSCEPFNDVTVYDPYVQVLKNIRIEYRNMTRSYPERWAGFQWIVWKYWHRIKNIAIKP